MEQCTDNSPLGSEHIGELESIADGAREPWVFRRLPVLPMVAVRIIEALDDETNTGDDIVSALQQSPEITAQILRAANSPRYGLDRSVDTLHQAFTVVGADRARQLALEHSMHGLLSKLHRYPPLVHCWHSCLTTGMVAKSLAPYFDIPPEKAYTAGLLHDIGRLALCASFPKSYVELIEMARDENLGILDGERSFFDIDHCEAGAWLVRRWKLPRSLETVAALHHGEELDERDLLTLIRGSWRLASIALAPQKTPAQQQSDQRKLIDRLPIADTASALEAVQAAAVSAKGYF